MSVIIYPAYFNIHYSRSKGRRVPKNLAFDAKIDTIAKAAKELGYSFEIEDKRYPRFWWSEKGRLVIETDEPKTEVIIKIAKKVKKL